MNDAITSQLSHFVTKNTPFSNIYVAYSGGLDSSVLLHALCAVVPDRALITALHVNHNLQTESGAWAQLCENQCSALGVKLKIHNLTLKSGSHEEERAREERYAFFTDILSAGDVLLMAHHLNDAVETFFFRLMRGSSSRGLTGIPENRTLGLGNLHRPLLKIRRTELEIYARQHSLEWLEDPSNTNTRYHRNYLRAKILPAFLERWPGAVESVATVISHMREDSQIIDAWLKEHLARVLKNNRELKLAVLLDYSDIQAKRILRHWLEQCGCFNISRPQLEEIYRQCAADTGPGTVFEVGKTNNNIEDFRDRLHKYRDILFFCIEYTGHLEASYPWKVQSDVSGQYLNLPHGQLRLEHPFGATVSTCFDVRFPIPGQKVALHCSSGISRQHKSLMGIFQEAGIPPWQRKQYPLLYRSDELIEIPGIRTVKSGFAPAMTPVPAKKMSAHTSWQPGLSATRK